jgi:transposase-like protein
MATINNNGTHTANLRRLYSLKNKLSIILEWETGSVGCNAVARKYHMQPFQMRDWKKKREGKLENAAAIKDVTSKHQFLSKMSCHERHKSETAIAELERMMDVYDDLRERDQVVNMSLLTHDLRWHNVSLKDLSASSVHR